LFELAEVGRGIIDVRGDLDDRQALTALVRDFRPEVVFHLAAQSLVLRSYEDPVETYRTNVLGTVHLLEAVRMTPGIRVVVNITTDKCYENREWDWGYRETDRLGGHDPYSNSKSCAEAVTAAYRHSFFHPEAIGRHGIVLASVRAGNVIGGGDWARNRLIPDVIRAFLNDETPQIRRPRAIRPWQHVLEPLNGYLLLAQRCWEVGSEFGEAWNFGPRDQEARPVAWIVEKLCELWGNDRSWQSDEQDYPFESRTLRLDCSKAIHRLGWTPRCSLEQALRMTVDWYRAYQQQADLRTVSLEQIEAYVRS
jgi:CDP-glucose 4,6-dehydratase